MNFIFINFVLWKEEKWFDIVECQFKDEIISDEYFNSFPLRFTPVRDVLLPITKFKKAPLYIVYPFSMAPDKQNKNLYYVLCCKLTFGGMWGWHSHSQNGDLGVLWDFLNFRVRL
jgi:hypothetical protein